MRLIVSSPNTLIVPTMYPVNMSPAYNYATDRHLLRASSGAAPYILEQLKNTESLGSMSYWTFTDVFEETGIPPRPFHGGFGLINLQGIRKPSFFAYQFLSRLDRKSVV